MFLLCLVRQRDDKWHLCHHQSFNEEEWLLEVLCLAFSAPNQLVSKLCSLVLDLLPSPLVHVDPSPETLSLHYTVPPTSPITLQPTYPHVLFWEALGCVWPLASCSAVHLFRQRLPGPCWFFGGLFVLCLLHIFPVNFLPRLLSSSALFT